MVDHRVEGRAACPHAAAQGQNLRTHREGLAPSRPTAASKVDAKKGAVKTSAVNVTVMTVSKAKVVYEIDVTGRCVARVGGGDV